MKEVEVSQFLISWAFNCTTSKLVFLTTFR